MISSSVLYLNSKLTGKEEVCTCELWFAFETFPSLFLAWWPRKCSCWRMPITLRTGQCRLGTYSLKVMYIWFLVSAKTLSFQSCSLYFSVKLWKWFNLKWPRSTLCLNHEFNWTTCAQWFLLRRWAGKCFLSLALQFLDLCLWGSLRFHHV